VGGGARGRGGGKKGAAAAAGAAGAPPAWNSAAIVAAGEVGRGPAGHALLATEWCDHAVRTGGDDVFGARPAFRASTHGARGGGPSTAYAAFLDASRPNRDAELARRDAERAAFSDDLVAAGAFGPVTSAALAAASSRTSGGAASSSSSSSSSSFSSAAHEHTSPASLSQSGGAGASSSSSSSGLAAPLNGPATTGTRAISLYCGHRPSRGDGERLLQWLVVKGILTELSVDNMSGHATSYLVVAGPGQALLAAYNAGSLPTAAADRVAMTFHGSQRIETAEEEANGAAGKADAGKRKRGAAGKKAGSGGADEASDSGAGEGGRPSRKRKGAAAGAVPLAGGGSAGRGGGGRAGAPPPLPTRLPQDHVRGLRAFLLENLRKNVEKQNDARRARHDRGELVIGPGESLTFTLNQLFPHALLDRIASFAPHTYSEAHSVDGVDASGIHRTFVGAVCALVKQYCGQVGITPSDVAAEELDDEGGGDVAARLSRFAHKDMGSAAAAAAAGLAHAGAGLGGGAGAGAGAGSSAGIRAMPPPRAAAMAPAPVAAAATLAVLPATTLLAAAAGTARLPAPGFVAAVAAAAAVPPPPVVVRGAAATAATAAPIPTLSASAPDAPVEDERAAFHWSVGPEVEAALAAAPASMPAAARGDAEAEDEVIEIPDDDDDEDEGDGHGDEKVNAGDGTDVAAAGGVARPVPSRAADDTEPDDEDEMAGPGPGARLVPRADDTEDEDSSVVIGAAPDAGAGAGDSDGDAADEADEDDAEADAGEGEGDEDEERRPFSQAEFEDDLYAYMSGRPVLAAADEAAAVGDEGFDGEDGRWMDAPSRPASRGGGAPDVAGMSEDGGLLLRPPSPGADE
jgi:hypothetical protein